MLPSASLLRHSSPLATVTAGSLARRPVGMASSLVLDGGGRPTSQAHQLASLSIGLLSPSSLTRAYAVPPPPTSSSKPLVSDDVSSSDRAPTPDAVKFAADARGRRHPLPAVSQPLQAVGKGVEGRHFLDDPAALLDLSKPFDGNWTLTHPAYTDEALDSVKVVQRPAITVSDRVAGKLVKALRAGFDLVSGYKHKPMPAKPEEYSLGQLRRMGCVMSPDQWLKRILFLEVIAGIPGMVAGTVRHLLSLRLLKRDGGWIHTLLEEAENERMHLLSFLALRQPGILFRALILAAQGVFYNILFISYLLAPRAVHRFVGFLEEEAVTTYTKCLHEMRSGYLPEWTDKKAPEIAINYWRMGQDATMFDLILNVRADEANHRFVNHTLASLDQRKDFNPFAIAEPDASLKATVPGFTREEAAAFAKQSREALEAKTKTEEQLTIRKH